MFWQTLWALVLGFGLSGAVQAFVSRAQMQRALGGRRPGDVARAGVLRGDLVVLFLRRLGAGQDAVRPRRGLHRRAGVHVRLHQPGGRAGHRAVAADRLAVRRGRVRRRRPDDRAALGGAAPGDQPAGAGKGPRRARRRTPGRTALTPGTAARSRARRLGARQDPFAAGWSDAAGYTISDLAMLRKELVIGFAVAGFADAAVPVSFWRSLFLTGHGFWSSAGERDPRPVPGGHQLRLLDRQRPAGRGAVDRRDHLRRHVAFVFADLITLPLLLIYRRYYGTAHDPEAARGVLGRR